MARNKYPEQTVEQILCIAEKLFTERGYEKTTIQDILNELKMSKGAIYHHFQSKEEILQAILDKKISFEQGLMRDLARSTQAGNAREKITKMLLAYLVGAAGAYDTSSKPLMLSVLNDPNIVLVSLQSAVLDMAPILSKLFMEGVADGSIQTSYPLEYAEVFMLLLSTWIKPTLFHRDLPETKRRLEACSQIMRQLGADIICDEMIEKTLQFYRENQLVKGRDVLPAE